MDDDPTGYRAEAEEFLRLAREARLPFAARVNREMAGVFERAAETIEKWRGLKRRMPRGWDTFSDEIYRLRKQNGV